MVSEALGFANVESQYIIVSDIKCRNIDWVHLCAPFDDIQDVLQDFLS